MKKGYEEIILPGKEDEMLDEAEDRYEGGVEEVSKPKFDYKKYLKKRYANGGSIGIEVLFEEKKPRQGLFMGGSPLEGQALLIYNSMNSYGFSDQEIADALRARGLYDAAPAVETPVVNTTPNIINQNRGGDGPTAPPGPTGPGFFSDLNKDDYEAEAYNVGPTFSGTFARGRMGIQSLISKLRSLPTPLNIALNVIENIKDPYKNPFGWFKQTN